MKDTKPFDSLREFVRLQGGLWSVLHDQYCLEYNFSILELPENGIIVFENRRWTFRRHGLGVVFFEINGKKRINLHDALNGVDSIDVWRLATYYGGLGREGEKLLEKAIGIHNGTMEYRIKLWLEQLVEDGKLYVEGDRYRLI